MEIRKQKVIKIKINNKLNKVEPKPLIISVQNKIVELPNDDKKTTNKLMESENEHKQTINQSTKFTLEGIDVVNEDDYSDDDIYEEVKKNMKEYKGI